MLYSTLLPSNQEHQTIDFEFQKCCASANATLTLVDMRILLPSSKTLNIVEFIKLWESESEQSSINYTHYVQQIKPNMSHSMKHINSQEYNCATLRVEVNETHLLLQLLGLLTVQQSLTNITLHHLH